MSESDLLEIAFYKGDAVHRILKRFEFSDDEKRIIRAAILTSRKDSPNMRSIAAANKLLENVAKTREPIKTPESERVTPEAIVKMEAMAFKEQMREKSLSEESSRFFRLDSKLSIAIVIALLIALYMYKNTYKKYTHIIKPVTYEEAYKLCQDKSQLLPLTYKDLDKEMRELNKKSEVGYWTEDRKIAHTLTQAFTSDDGKKHYVKCVKVNNLQYTR